MTAKARKIEKVKELYNEGYLPAQIGRIVGITPATIRVWLKDEGVYRYDYYTAKETIESIREMYQKEGMTAVQIAKELDMKPLKVKNIISTYDLNRTHFGKPNDDGDFEKPLPEKKDDPIFYIEHKPTNERVTYGNKKYKDVSAMLLG